jgi:uridylate kinase
MQGSKPAYKRVLLKLSGEALLGDLSFGVDPKILNSISQDIIECTSLDVEIAIVIGGGNFFRGEVLAKTGFDRVTCDQMGMLATVMNGLVLRDTFTNKGIPANVMSSIAIQGVVETYDRARAKAYLQDKHVVLFVAGIGCPMFSTDSAASLRGIEVGAEVILKATKVDGVYSTDPKRDVNAKQFHKLTFKEAIKRRLRIMDTSAMCICQENNMPIRVFNMNEPGILKKIILGSTQGTLINNE